jgi:hypothetical protein
VTAAIDIGKQNLFRGASHIEISRPKKFSSFSDCYDSAMAGIETSRGATPEAQNQLRNARQARLNLKA